MARKMRDSGVEWIGKVPEGWEIARLKSLFSYGKGLAITKADLTPKGMPVISYGQIHSKANSGTHLQDELLRCVSAEYLQTDGDCLLKKNDFVFADTSEDLEGLGNCAFVDRDDKIFAGYHTIVFHPKCDMPSKYLAYLFKTDCWRSQFRAKAYGIKVYSLSQRLLNDCSVVLPQEQEAERIADYLDEKCAAIDGAVDELKRGIEDCKAWKKAIIFEAVTGKRQIGFNAEKQRGRVAERPMRDTGIPWIGEIPEGWEVVKARRFIASTQNGLTRRDLSESKGEIVLRLKNISSDGHIDYSDVLRIELSESEKSAYGLTTGDLLFARVNGSRSLVGKCAEYVGNREFVAYNDHLIRVRVNDTMIARRFFTYYLLGQAGKTEIELHASTSAGQFTISGEGLRDITVVMPSLSEQLAIADFLDEKCAAIDALVAEKEKLIADLEAYKKSLIFELVTGKREVA